VTSIVAADIGGTNARFTIATLDDKGVPTLGEVRKYKVADYPSLAACWRAFKADAGEPLPDCLSVAFAAAIASDSIKLTNSSWVIRPANLAQDLGLSEVKLVNDFEAVAYAVAKLPLEALPVLFGPDVQLPTDGTVTILGPGTGLGVAMILFANGEPHVIATEGGHIDFAPLDALEGRILDHLRGDFVRVSTERIVSGPGLNNLYKSLAMITHEPITLMSDADLWQAALDGTQTHPLARAALERLCMCYGSIAGDLALTHGPHHVVLAGGLTQRMRDFLVHHSNFHERFTAKGRFQALMRTIPVRLAAYPEIGLYGAAAAWGTAKNKAGQHI
jgi:glucokinase